MMMMMMKYVYILQKVAAGQGQVAAPDTRPEHVIGVIERPSQLRIASSPAQQYPQTVIPPAPPPPPSQQIPRVASVATSGGGRRDDDINQQLVERIDELYRQVHGTLPTAV